MAHVIKRTTASGDRRYHVRTRIDGRQVTKTFRTLADANAYASNIERDKTKGVAIDPRKSKRTVREYADQWLNERHDIAVRTTELYRYLLDKHVLPTLGSMTSAFSPAPPPWCGAGTRSWPRSTRAPRPRRTDSSPRS